MAAFACEACGAPVSGEDGCPAHPGARLLDLEVPANADYAASLQALRVGRWSRVIRGGGLVLMLGFLLSDAVAPLAKGIAVASACVAGLLLYSGAFGANVYQRITGLTPPGDGFGAHRATIRWAGLVPLWGALVGLLAWSEMMPDLGSAVFLATFATAFVIQWIRAVFGSRFDADAPRDP